MKQIIDLYAVINELHYTEYETMEMGDDFESVYAGDTLEELIQSMEKDFKAKITVINSADKAPGTDKALIIHNFQGIPEDTPVDCFSWEFYVTQRLRDYLESS